MNRLRVLIVESSEDTAALLSKQLEVYYGVTDVKIVRNSQDAVRALIAEDGKYDAMIMDWEVCRFLAEIAKTLRLGLPVGVITAMNLDVVKIEALEGYCLPIAYLRKPYTADELFVFMKKLLPNVDPIAEAA